MELPGQEYMKTMDKSIKLPDRWKDWEITKSIGSGSYGDVYEAVYRGANPSVTTRKVAVKVIRIPSGSAEAAAPAAETELKPLTAAEVSTSLAQIDMAKWQYNADDDVYYQLGISYCATPADASYETLAVFVPGAYMTGTDNGDGTYTCTLSEDGTVSGYTALTAPIVMPINTPGYSAQRALSEYTSVKSYTDAGFVYVHAGCRGQREGSGKGPDGKHR